MSCIECREPISNHSRTQKLACALAYKKRLEKIILTSLLVLGIATVPHMAGAQQSTIQMFANGEPVELSNQNPDVITSLHAGDFIRGTTSEAVQVAGTVQNLMTQTGLDGTTWTFQVPAYQSNLRVGSQEFVFIPAQNNQIFGIDIATLLQDVAGVAVAIVVVALIFWAIRRNRKSNRNWMR